MSFQDSVNFSNPSIPALSSEDIGVKTHPESSEKPTSILDTYIIQVRYKQYDLCREGDVEELENVMTTIEKGEAILRQEKWSHDKDGLTLVTLSWIDLTPKAGTKKTAPVGTLYPPTDSM